MATIDDVASMLDELLEDAERAEKAAKAAQHKIQNMQIECSTLRLWMVLLPITCFLLSGLGAALGIYLGVRF